MTLVRAANHLFHALEPWNLKKRGQWEQLNATMAVTMETARVVGVLLHPIIPSFSSRLLGKSHAPACVTRDS
jgi:methionyl-tRNA synthetase